MPGAPRWQVSLCKSIPKQLLDAGAPLHKVSSFLGQQRPEDHRQGLGSESEP